MPTDPQPAPTARSADAYADAAPAPRPAGRARLEAEWRRLQRAFAYHPYVTVTPVAGDPPTEYQVDYRLTAVVVSPQTNQLEYVAVATVQVTLPPGFPDEPPTVRPTSPVFHPNVSYDGIFLEGLWHPDETLLGLVRKVGDVLAYRSYDPGYAVNPAAMQWMTANHNILPTDTQADLTPTAGGEPLARVAKYGPPTVESIRQALAGTQAALLGAAPPDAATVRAYVDRSRRALALFLDPDVPAEVRDPARALDAAARELVDARAAYDAAGDRRRRAVALRQAVGQLAASAGPLAAEVERAAGLAYADGVVDPMAALKLIPAAAVLHPSRFALPKLVDEARARVVAVRAEADAVGRLQPPTGAAAGSPLGDRLARELAAGAEDVWKARGEAAEALSAFAPALARAEAAAQALAAAAGWREYLDLAEKAKQIERRLRDWGAEGVQAYYVRNAGGRYGPFQFEQSVDLGAGDLVVRTAGGKTIELRDPRRDVALATKPTGVIDAMLPAPPPAEGEEPEVDANGQPVRRGVATRIAMTDRCDDLAVQLEFLRRSALETVTRSVAYAGDDPSWAGVICRVLARPPVRKEFEHELAIAARRWRHTIVDLVALGAWKERLATYLLLHRCTETILPLAQAAADGRRQHAASKKRLADVLAKSGRDPATGAVVVPPRLTKAYDEEVKLQARVEAEAKASAGLLRSLAGQLAARLQDPKLLGKGDRLQLRALPPLPETLSALRMSDGAIGHLVAPLEEALQTPLGGPPPGDEVESAEAEADGSYASDAVLVTETDGAGSGGGEDVADHRARPPRFVGGDRPDDARGRRGTEQRCRGPLPGHRGRRARGAAGRAGCRRRGHDFA